MWNGTMFVDLDCPLNASSLLSASAELLVRDAENGAAVIIGNWPAPRVYVPRPCMFVVQYMSIYSQRLQVEHWRSAVTISIQSLTSWMFHWKYAIWRYTFFSLVETWNDADSFSFRRLRLGAFEVVDHPRQRTCSATLATKHGGVAAVAVLGVRLCKIDVGIKADTVQLLCTTVFSSSSHCDVTVIYRTGSTLQHLFTDLCNLLDCGTIYVDPVYVVGFLQTFFRCTMSTMFATRKTSPYIGTG